MVTLNLVQNAFRAMPNGGHLGVSVRQRDQVIELRITDTGVGITRQDLQHIFDPFFSRRADGSQGTGLGLSITRSIVEKFTGTIEVESHVGSGTSFAVKFPDPAFSAGATS